MVRRSLSVGPEDLKTSHWEEIFKLMLITVKSYLGSPLSEKYCSVRMLRIFAIEVCREKLDPDRLDAIIQEVDRMKKRGSILKLRVIRAEDVPPKDANQLSDPYCKVWLTKKRIYKTPTIKETLNPVWNSTFEIDITEKKDKDLSERALRIEVWDEDPRSILEAAAEIRRLKLCGGCRHCIRDFCELCWAKCTGGNADDFIGSVVIPLDQIPSVKSEMQIYLDPRRYVSKVEKLYEPEHSVGTLVIEMEIQGKVPEGTDRKVLLQQHLLLYQICFTHPLKETVESKTMMYQHSVQNCISRVEDDMCRWLTIVTYQVAGKVPMDWKHVLSLLESLLTELVAMEADPECMQVHPIIARSMLRSLDIFVDIITVKLQRLHFYIVGSEEDFENLGFYLQGLFLIYCFKRKGMLGTIFLTLQKEAKKYFYKAFVYFRPKFHNPETMGATLQLITDVFLSSIRVTDAMFERYLACSYSCFIWHIVDECMVELFQPVLVRFLQRKSDIDTILNIYLKVKCLRDYLEESYEVNSAGRAFQLDSFHLWFGSPKLHEWFTSQRIRAFEMIKRSVDKDSLTAFDDVTPPYGTSVVDAKTVIFAKLYLLWKLVGWPDKETSVFLLFEEVCSCISFFLEVTEERVRQEMSSSGKSIIFYQSAGDTPDDLRKKLCVAVTNMIVLMEYTDEITSIMSREDEVEESLLVSTKAIVAKRRELWHQSVITVAKSIVTIVGKNLKSKIQRITESENDRECGDALVELRSYLFETLWVLHRSLESDAFKTVFLHLWGIILSSFEDIVAKASGGTKLWGFQSSLAASRIGYTGLLTALTELEGEFKSITEITEKDLQLERLRKIRLEIYEATKKV